MCQGVALPQFKWVCGAQVWEPNFLMLTWRSRFSCTGQAGMVVPDCGNKEASSQHIRRSFTKKSSCTANTTDTPSSQWWAENMFLSIFKNPTIEIKRREKTSHFIPFYMLFDCWTMQKCYLAKNIFKSSMNPVFISLCNFFTPKLKELVIHAIQ